MYVCIVKKRKEKPFSFFLYEIVVKRLLPSGFPYRHFVRLASQQQHRKVRATLALVCVKVSCVCLILWVTEPYCRCHVTVANVIKNNTRKFLMYSFYYVYILKLYLRLLNQLFQGVRSVPLMMNMPQISKMEVQCAKSGMSVEVEFDLPFDGIIFSKGHFSDPACR